MAARTTLPLYPLGPDLSSPSLAAERGPGAPRQGRKLSVVKRVLDEVDGEDDGSSMQGDPMSGLSGKVRASKAEAKKRRASQQQEQPETNVNLDSVLALAKEMMAIQMANQRSVTTLGDEALIEVKCAKLFAVYKNPSSCLHGGEIIEMIDSMGVVDPTIIVFFEQEDFSSIHSKLKPLPKKQCGNVAIFCENCTYLLILKVLIRQYDHQDNIN